MSILAFLVARHCALYWFIVFHYSFFLHSWLINWLIDWLIEQLWNKSSYDKMYYLLIGHVTRGCGRDVIVVKIIRRYADKACGIIIIVSVSITATWLQQRSADHWPVNTTTPQQVQHVVKFCNKFSLKLSPDVPGRAITEARECPQ